ncbi:MAG: glutamate synthase large subunit [Desulfovibrio sp.]|jgi:glutamate synthase domain-containing protein 2/glutamate synthase domain-containing protein 1/glutamate synthase domain-containing protein 3|nr:glutamate synthase large subunit [Desulfovibrio sp.]
MSEEINNSLYIPADHDACGVGFIARLDASPSHALVGEAVTALARMGHRGGACFTPDTPDGAGILFPLPQAFMRKIWRPICGEFPHFAAVGQFFLPPEAKDMEQIETLLEHVLSRHALRLAGKRDVPLRRESLRPYAEASCPFIRQYLVAPTEACLQKLRDSSGAEAGASPEDMLERILYVARRHLENSVRDKLPHAMRHFHVCSFSANSIVYKGLLSGGSLSAFYADLADTDFSVHFAVFHERYSTNTRPMWRLAQPFHCLAHNGEINTLACNKANMAMREPLLCSALYGEDIRHLVPVLDPRGSDSSTLDNCLEFLHRGGRTIAHAAMMLVPEPFGPAYVMGEDKRAFYEYHAAIMEPWDGPSALVFTDGKRQLGAMLDRNALRPCRYARTKDGFFILASEAGVLDLPDARIVERGRLQPRRMLMIDFARGRVIDDAECKGRVIYEKPYRHWVRQNGLALRDLPLPSGAPSKPASTERATLIAEQLLFGYSKEDISDILVPMARDAQEPVSSMGTDIPLAVLSGRPQLLFHYFKQRFAQVTNPPIDPLREGLVMTLTGFAGKMGNLLEEKPEQYTRLRLANPLLNAEDVTRLLASEHPAAKTSVLPIFFDATHAEAGEALGAALEELFGNADKALEKSTLLLLSDAGAGPGQAPIPSLLAVSALHRHLLRKGIRHACSLLVDTGEAREVMHIAQLIAFGASAVYPRTAFASIEALADEGALGTAVTPLQARTAYANAIHKGLLKTFSRMGISTLRSFSGGQGFEAVGLGKELLDTHFSGIPSRIGGIGLSCVAAEALSRHAAAFGKQSDGASPAALPQAGRHKYRKDGERHLWTPSSVRALQRAVRDNDKEAYREFAGESDAQTDSPVTLRGLLTLKNEATPIPLTEVEAEESIMRRFVGAAMSYGSISPEAHEAIAIACNRVGARSNCGEGGEGPERNHIRENGDNPRSRVRQIASGRFGVSAEYIMYADEAQIKIAQGAKPGEGGQLPAHKVLPDIARVRRTTAGITLISPPPHHDIYSIEDLAQLIYDLKSLNPKVRVSVKLVAGSGVGTVAAGVAKAGADGIVISGHDGGTGASPRSAVEYVGLPWEMGLSETQAALCANGLRARVRLQTDGQLRTGKDLVMAALLGADEFAFGTSLLVSLGCCLLRVCHLGSCAVGIATQEQKLRARFSGSPEHVERYLRFLAWDMRLVMANLGFRSVDEMIGRGDLLTMAPLSPLLPETQTVKLRSLDLSPLIINTHEFMVASACGDYGERPPHAVVESPLNGRMFNALEQDIRKKRPCRFSGVIANTDRAVGSRVAGEIARLHGDKGLAPGTVQIELSGTAGQSIGAFLTRGIFLRMRGEANDYAGKGLSGGMLAVCPPEESQRMSWLSKPYTAVGNVSLYGATSGEAFFAGSAGERFAVRNSGATAVVEGVGDHACEYMTGGVVVVLGPTGYNFGAGMSGGVAYVFDQSEQFQNRCNMHSVDMESVWKADDVQLLHKLLTDHVRHTGSLLAGALLRDWQEAVPLFLKVTPIGHQRSLERMKFGEGNMVERIAATEEVYKPTDTKRTA